VQYIIEKQQKHDGGKKKPRFGNIILLSHWIKSEDRLNKINRHIIYFTCWQYGAYNIYITD